MIKNVAAAALFLVVLLTGVHAGQVSALVEPVNTIRIISVKPMADGIYAMVSLEYPK